MAEATDTNSIALLMPSLRRNAALARVTLAAFAGHYGFTLRELEELKVAIAEAVGNCALHAYPAEEPGPVEVRARFAEGCLTVEVADRGRGIEDVAQARQPAFTTSADPDHVGLGFAFMEQFSDTLEVDSRPGAGTVVRLTKRPQPRANPGPEIQ